MHVLLELADALLAEGVRDDLAFASVLVAVAGVEQAAADGNEGIVVVTARRLVIVY